MKKITKEGACKYLLVGIVSLLISGTSVILASDERKKEDTQILIEQITTTIESEVEQMAVQKSTLEEQLNEIKE